MLSCNTLLVALAILLCPVHNRIPIPALMRRVGPREAPPCAVLVKLGVVERHVTRTHDALTNVVDAVIFVAPAGEARLVVFFVLFDYITNDALCV